MFSLVISFSLQTIFLGIKVLVGGGEISNKSVIAASCKKISSDDKQICSIVFILFFSDGYPNMSECILLYNFHSEHCSRGSRLDEISLR